MRRPAALVLALFPAILALACGSTPSEREETTSAAIISCPVGEHLYCDTNEVTGKLLCTCQQNSCTYAPAPPPPSWAAEAWIAAWASPPLNGTCPVIKTSTGLWADVGDVLGPTDQAYVNGVPTDSVSMGSLTPSGCSQVAGMPSNCCTYVWWPNGYPSYPDKGLPTQDFHDLCPVNGATLVPIEQLPCNPTGGHKCDEPGNGGCPSCTGVN
jgi:hypothetical protein